MRGRDGGLRYCAPPAATTVASQSRARAQISPAASGSKVRIVSFLASPASKQAAQAPAPSWASTEVLERFWQRLRTRRRRPALPCAWSGGLGDPLCCPTSMATGHSEGTQLTRLEPAETKPGGRFLLLGRSICMGRYCDGRPLSRAEVFRNSKRRGDADTALGGTKEAIVSRPCWSQSGKKAWDAREGVTTKQQPGPANVSAKRRERERYPASSRAPPR